MAYSGFKGIGPNGLGGSKKSVISPTKQTKQTKQMGIDAGETAAFEESKRLELLADERMERAKGDKKKQAKIKAETNKKMDKKVPEAKKKAEKGGYTPFGESKKIPAKKQ
jgi:hypothetical protein